ARRLLGGPEPPRELLPVRPEPGPAAPAGRRGARTSCLSTQAADLARLRTAGGRLLPVPSLRWRPLRLRITPCAGARPGRGGGGGPVPARAARPAQPRRAPARGRRAGHGPPEVAGPDCGPGPPAGVTGPSALGDAAAPGVRVRAGAAGDPRCSCRLPSDGGT